MCGIAGVLGHGSTRNADELEHVVLGMTRTLRHRGPDDEGAWVDPAAGVGLGYRRLAIVDLSPAGHQPMSSADGRYVVVFNGEIYNFLELRGLLEARGHGFRGHSDTEVMLAAFTEWGLRETLTRLNGMFAFALWDRADRTLSLIRDRLGEKPLYYGWVGRTFLFGSELKALRANPDFAAEIDREAVELYLRHKCVPAPWSIYRGIQKLPPGALVTLKNGSRMMPEPQHYWSAEQVALAGVGDPYREGEQQAVQELEALLLDAVRIRMQADVPLGAFLSGGLDSSTVVALMQAQSPEAVKTFTIGYQEAAYDEARDARAIAGRLGTDHTELYVTPEETLATIPRLPSVYDEPFSDSSQIPTLLISELARTRVTVSLSGDGGDEVFGGYNRYQWAPRVWRRVGRVPRPVRRAGAWALDSLSPARWDAVYGLAGSLLRRRAHQRNAGEKAQKLAQALRADSPAQMYTELLASWQDAAFPLATRHGLLPAPTIPPDGQVLQDLDFARRMMFWDTVSYLPDDILTKVDRASMSVSLEARVPYLDHRVVEFAWRLPLSMKLRDGMGKWILRQILYRHVPRDMVERPKMGFGIPIGLWLQGPLRQWAEDLLDPNRIRREGFFDPGPIGEKWTEHLDGKRNWQYPLWTVLMFQAWLDESASSLRSQRLPAGVGHESE